MANEVNMPGMPRGIGAQLTSDQLDDLRDFLEELDVVPLSALPSEVWPLVYEHQRMITAPDFDPPPVEVRFYDNLNKRLRERKKLRKQSKQTELLPFNF